LQAIFTSYSSLLGRLRSVLHIQGPLRKEGGLGILRTTWSRMATRRKKQDREFV